MAFFHVGDLGLFGDGLSLDFEHFKRVNKIISLQSVNVSSMATINHDRVAIKVLQIVIVFQWNHAVLDAYLVDVLVVLLVVSLVS